MMRVAFLGLGAMGEPMARNILTKGFPLTVWNRNPGRARPLVEAGARLAASPREAASGSEAVCTMLADPAAVDAVAGGPDGLAAGLSTRMVWLDFSTVTPADSRRFAALAKEKGADFCDLPVAGSIGPAAEGTLTLLAGGDPAVLERVKPLLDAVSRATEWCGPVGQGSALKLVNNLSYGVALAAFGEALALARRLGLDQRRTTDWLLSTPAVGPYVRRKIEHVASGGASQFSLALMRGLHGDFPKHERLVDSPLALVADDLT